MSARKAPRARDATASKASGKAKTAPAKQKPATGQRGVRNAAPPFDHEVAGLLKQLVLDGAAASAAPPAMPRDDSEKRGKDGFTPTERAYLEEHQPAEDNARQAKLFAHQAQRMDEGQTVAANTTSEQLAQNTAALLEFAVRLRMAAEARAHTPAMPGYEDPLVFAETVAGLIPQLVRATHLLVEFLNADCDAGGLATEEINAVRCLMESWPDFYFRHAGAQTIQTKKYKPEKLQIGSKLPWYIHQGKGDPVQSPYVMAAIHTLQTVYSNLVRFALQPAGTNGKENPLRTWVRKNDIKALSKFTLTMRYAPEQHRLKAMREQERMCPGWTPPSWLSATPEDETLREFAGRHWSDEVCYKIVEHIDKYQEQLQEDGAVVERRIDFIAWAPALKQVLEGGANPPAPRSAR
jgi:hypothetical protein